MVPGQQLQSRRGFEWEETSIQNEDRFENWETKSRILDTMGRKDDASKTLAAAINKASAIQLYSYARGLQRKKCQARF